MKQPIVENVSSYYNKIAFDYAQRNQKLSFHLEDFIKLLKKGQKVLDVGCGHGINSDYMKKNGIDVVGVDLSEEMIGLAKKMNNRIDFMVADMRELDFLPVSFDAIIANFSLIHLSKKDVPVVLLRFNYFLKSGGLLLVGIQEGQSEERYQLSPNKFDELFFNIMSREELIDLLKQAGFKIIKKFFRKPKKNELKFNKFIVISKKI